MFDLKLNKKVKPFLNECWLYLCDIWSFPPDIFILNHLRVINSKIRLFRLPAKIRKKIDENISLSDLFSCCSFNFLRKIRIAFLQTLLDFKIWIIFVSPLSSDNLWKGSWHNFSMLRFHHLSHFLNSRFYANERSRDFCLQNEWHICDSAKCISERSWWLQMSSI